MSDFKAKMYPIQIQRSPDPLAGLRGPTHVTQLFEEREKGREGTGRGGEGWDGRVQDPAPSRHP